MLRAVCSLSPSVFLPLPLSVFLPLLVYITIRFSSRPLVILSLYVSNSDSDSDSDFDFDSDSDSDSNILLSPYQTFSQMVFSPNSSMILSQERDKAKIIFSKKRYLLCIFSAIYSLRHVCTCL